MSTNLRSEIVELGRGAAKISVSFWLQGFLVTFQQVSLALDTVSVTLTMFPRARVSLFLIYCFLKKSVGDWQ